MACLFDLFMIVRDLNAAFTSFLILIKRGDFIYSCHSLFVETKADRPLFGQLITNLANGFIALWVVYRITKSLAKLRLTKKHLD